MQNLAELSITVPLRQPMLHVSSKNMPSKWEAVYDKYCPSIYGMICKLTTDKNLADKILVSVFLKIKAQNIINSEAFARSPMICLLRYTYKSAIKYLSEKGEQISIDANSSTPFQILWMICTQCEDLKTLSVQLGISEADARKRLFVEFSLLNMQRQIAISA